MSLLHAQLLPEGWIASDYHGGNLVYATACCAVLQLDLTIPLPLCPGPCGFFTHPGGDHCWRCDGACYYCSTGKLCPSTYETDRAAYVLTMIDRICAMVHVLASFVFWL